jgi:probable HAF family extracellular repeat protein
MPTYSYSTLNEPLSTYGTNALGINDSGQIVGYYVDSNPFYHGFLYSGGTYTTLDDPSARNTGGTFAEGINASGQTVGYYGGSVGNHGFLYSGGTYTTLDDPSATQGTYAYAINDAG